MGIIYDLLAFIDWVIYSLASSMFRIIIDIANVEFFNVEQITTIANRIYIVVGVLMLFKLVISAVQYMINPDTFDDKEKGVAGILKKTAISLGLIVVVPAIFNFMVSIQGSIIKTLPSIILGTNPTESVDYDKLGNDLSFTVLSSFVKVNENKGSNEITDIDSFKSKVTQGCPRLFGNVDDCKYNYMIIISTISGGFLCYVLLSMILDVAIRTIKFSIIRILAPIPISSYVFSKDKLSKFVKTTITVYTDLFIRLAIVYFIIFAIQNIVIESNLFKELAKDGGWFRETIIRIAIIFGLLMFAKTAPKFISELLGIPDTGAGDMKDMFTRGGALLGTTAAGLRTARSNYTTQKERAFGKGQSKTAQRLRGALGAAAGFGSATGRGLWMTGQGKGFKDVRQGASKAAINARNRRIERADHLYNKERYIDAVDEQGNYILDANGNRTKVKNPEYYGYMDYRRDVRREKLGIPSDTAFIKARYDAMEKIAKSAADAKGHGVGKMNETPNRYQISFRDRRGEFASDDFKTINYALGYESLSMEQVRNMYAMAKNGQDIDHADGKSRVHLNAAQIDALGTLVQTIEKRTSYMKEAELMATGDPVATPNVDKLVIGLKTNRDMFNAKEIMAPIILKMDKDLKNYRVNPNDPTDHRVSIDGKEFDVSKYNGLLDIVQHLQIKITEPKASDDKYKDMKKRGVPDAQIKAEFDSDRKKYFDTIAIRADILTGIKDSFEEVTKTQYKAAQIADNKAQKAQQAVSNNDKKS